MGSKKNKNLSLRDLMIDLRDKVIQDDDMGKIYGGTSNHQNTDGNRGCGGIVPQ